MLTKRFSTWTRIPTAKSVSKNSRKSLERGDQKPTSLISWPLTRLPSSKKNLLFLICCCFVSAKSAGYGYFHRKKVIWKELSTGNCVVTHYGNNILIGSFVTFYKIDFISMNRLSIMTRLYYDDKANPSFSITLFQ